MAEVQTKQDLFLNVIKNPDKSVEDMIQIGLDADNVSFESREKYRNSKKVQELFTDSEGVFKEDAFNSAYTASLRAYNALTNIKAYNLQMDPFKYDQKDFTAPEDAKRQESPNFEIVRVSNPLNQTTGISTFGKTEAPTKTWAEVAQGQRALNDDIWEEAPEDSWWGNLFDTKVLAQYDEDGTHIDPISGDTVTHKAGQYKLNELGKPYYESLNGRDVYGKQVLNKFDILTKEDSTFNKYDFFDTDGYDKNAFGSILKTTAQIAPMFIPYVGPVYTGLNVAIQGAGLLATLGKMVNIDDMFYDNSMLNNIEGWTKSVGRDTRSEYAKQHMWSLENMIGLIGDVAGQLKEQRWIFQYGPALFKPSAMSWKGIDQKSQKKVC